jgi:hypothetical protein
VERSAKGNRALSSSTYIAVLYPQQFDSASPFQELFDTLVAVSESVTEISNNRPPRIVKTVTRAIQRRCGGDVESRREVCACVASPYGTDAPIEESLSAGRQAAATTASAFMTPEIFLQA